MLLEQSRSWKQIFTNSLFCYCLFPEFFEINHERIHSSKTSEIIKENQAKRFERQSPSGKNNNYFIPLRVYTPALADGLSLEYE